MEKAQTLHDKVMKLLVRRYVTAEQRRRDDYGITEDDIIEVRQDISSLRFELLEIFTNNSWDVPDIEKKTQGKEHLSNMLPGISATEIPLPSLFSSGTHHQGQGNGTSYSQRFPDRFCGEFEAGDEREREWTRYLLLTGQGHRQKEDPEGVGLKIK